MVEFIKDGRRASSTMVIRDASSEIERNLSETAPLYLKRIVRCKSLSVPYLTTRSIIWITSRVIRKVQHRGLVLYITTTI